MTQLEQAGRRTTVLISAAVALVVSLTITISGMFIIPELTSAPTSGGVDRYAESGRAWQVQRELESSHFRNGLLSGAGYPAGWSGGAAVPISGTPLVEREAHWQRYKEQTNVPRGAADDAWPGGVREEPLRPTDPVPFPLASKGVLDYLDPRGEVPDLPAWADLASIQIQPDPADGGALVTIHFRLAGEKALTSLAAYGVVADVDGDGRPDYRIGMDNLDGTHHREWISELLTGEASFNRTRSYGHGAFGMSTDTYYPGQELAYDAGSLIASVGSPGMRFYVWASAMDREGNIVTDYAPDVGWLEFFPNRQCDGGCADPVPAPPPPDEHIPSP